MSIISDNLNNITAEIENKLKEISGLSVSRYIRNWRLTKYTSNVDIIIQSISRRPISLTGYEFTYNYSIILTEKWDQLSGSNSLSLLDSVIDKLDELRQQNASILSYCTEVEIGDISFRYEEEGNRTITFMEIPLIVYS